MIIGFYITVTIHRLAGCSTNTGKCFAVVRYFNLKATNVDFCKRTPFYIQSVVNNIGRNIAESYRQHRLLNAKIDILRIICMEHWGQVVSRELIIKEVWNDYPGGGDGLNQAISGLRKLLEDDQKKIIETLPKTGYCFHGTVEAPRLKQQTPPFKTVYILAGLLTAIAVLFLVRHYQSTKASITEQLSREEARTISRIDSANQAARLKAANIKQ